MPTLTGLHRQASTAAHRAYSHSYNAFHAMAGSFKDTAAAEKGFKIISNCLDVFKKLGFDHSSLNTRIKNSIPFLSALQAVPLADHLLFSKKQESLPCRLANYSMVIYAVFADARLLNDCDKSYFVSKSWSWLVAEPRVADAAYASFSFFSGLEAFWNGENRLKAACYAGKVGISLSKVFLSKDTRTAWDTAFLIANLAINCFDVYISYNKASLTPKTPKGPATPTSPCVAAPVPPSSPRRPTQGAPQPAGEGNVAVRLGEAAQPVSPSMHLDSPALRPDQLGAVAA